MKTILKIVLLYLLMQYSANAICKTATVDSILKHIDAYSDTTKVDILLKACWNFRSRKPEEALIMGKEALRLIEQRKLDSKKATVLNYVGVVYLAVGKSDSAFVYFQEALIFAKRTSNNIEVGFAYNNFADFYFGKALYALALENVLIAHDIFSKANFKPGLGYTLNNLGEIYIKQQLYDKALDTLESAVNIRQTLSDDVRASISKRNIAAIYILKKEYNKALDIFEKLLQANKKNNLPIRQAIVLDGISDIYYEKQDFETALKYRQDALAIYSKTLNRPAEAQALNKLGLIYIAMEQFQLAKETLLKAEALIVTVDDKILQLVNYQNQAKLGEKSNDNASAVKFYQLYLNLNDSIFSSTNKTKILELELAYGKVKQEKEILMLKQEKKTRINLLIFLSLSICLLIALISNLLYQRKKNIEIKKELEELNQSKDRFFSILAHDLRGPLSTLNGLTNTLDDKYDKFTQARVKEIINVMRVSTNNIYNLLTRLLEWSSATTGRITCRPVSFPVYKEADNVLQLVSNMAANKKLNLVSEIDPDHIVNADPNMINTIMRNLVSNAIKFTPERGCIKLFSNKKENRINIWVADSGIGLSKPEIESVLRIDKRHTKPGTNNEEGTGVGLALCSELLKANKGKLWIESKPGKGSKFYFSLPKGD